MSDFHVRWMIRRDMQTVFDIEKLSFEFPWTENDFMKCLRQRNVIGMVAESLDETVVGYMVYELHADHLHVINFAVAPDRRGQGVGKTMIAKLKSKLSPQRRHKIVMEVRETNLDGLLFLKAMEFRAEKTLRGFYVETKDDAYQMEFSLTGRRLNLTNRISRLYTP